MFEHYSTVAAALWGLFGGGAVEVLEFLRAVRRTKNWPWLLPDGRPNPDEVPPAPFFVSVVLRAGLGAGLAAGVAEAGQISGSLGAIGFGVAAPLVLEQLGGSARRSIGGGSAAAEQGQPPHSPPPDDSEP